jgi:gliding motility-associated-like protein
MKPSNYFIPFLAVIFISKLSFSQYILNGSATQNRCNCYTLTTETRNESGSVWNSNKIDLTHSFDFYFNVYLGCIDSTGADGIAFVLQPISTNIGAIGEGLGFEGVSPSVGISLDTWQNTRRNDPSYDHINIQLNGVVTHGNDLAGPVPASATSENIEDCQWHVLRIAWDAMTKILTTWFDGQLRLQTQYDLVAKVFNNDPMVYWGFSGATGGGFNLQRFCTALNPVFKTNLANNSACFGDPVIFSDQSQSFTTIKEFYWNFGDGSVSSFQDPPTHHYSLPGAYVVKHVITGMDGCVSDTIEKVINIGAKPIPDFLLSDTCTDKTLVIQDRSSSAFGAVSHWSWTLDGNINSADQQPVFSDLSRGPHQLSMAVSSIYDCKSDTIVRNFSILPTPVVNLEAGDGCWGQPLRFFGNQADSSTTIIEWNWKFGDGLTSQEQNPVHVYSRAGSKIIHLTVNAGDGCVSNDITKQIHIEDIYVDAGNDTSVQANIPFKLNANWTGDFSGVPVLTWSPQHGLSTTDGNDPTAVLQNDQVYYLTAITNEGCKTVDSIKIRVFNSPGVLVPSAFTPNSDGLNDLLRPRYNGIKSVNYFSVYDRWGELVFKTSDMTKGWDGKVNGQLQGNGTFVWIISAEGFDGKKFQLKGTTTIIK